MIFIYMSIAIKHIRGKKISKREVLMIRFTRILSLFAVLLLVSACGGGASAPPPPVTVDPNADYSVTYTSTGSRPVTIANGTTQIVVGSSKQYSSDTFDVKALTKNVTISTLVFRCQADCSLIVDIYFTYVFSSTASYPFSSARADLKADGAVVVNFSPPMIAEVGMGDGKTWLSVGYNIASFDPSRGSATFHLDYDGTDPRNQAVETATGLPVNGNKQVITTPGHIICPQTTLSDSWSCA
jgi:hypothetical protein